MQAMPAFTIQSRIEVTTSIFCEVFSSIFQKWIGHFLTLNYISNNKHIAIFLDYIRLYGRDV